MSVKVIAISTSDDDELTDQARDNLTLCVMIAESFRKFLEHKGVPAPGQIATLGIALVDALRDIPEAERDAAVAAHILSLKASLGMMGAGGGETAGSVPAGATKH